MTTAEADDANVVAPSIGRRAATWTRRAPWWLWAGGLVVLLPVAVPVLSLVWNVLGASDEAWSLVFELRTLELVGRSIMLVALVTASSLVVGTAAAWIVVRTDLPGRRWWTVAVALPLVIPSYVLALSFLALSGPRGLAAELLGFGLPIIDGLPGAWLALTLSTYPYVYLVAAASLRRLDPALEEAARGLGASPRRVFRTVVLPQLRPALGAGAILTALYTLSDFGAVSLMRYDVFTRVIYAQYSGRLDRTPAAVLSVVLIVLALFLIVLEHRTRGRETFFSHRATRPPSLHALSPRARLAAGTALGLVVAAGLGIPIAVLGTWLARGIRAGGGVGVAWDAVGGSLVASLLAAVLAMIGAIPVVVLAVRHPGRASTTVERAVGIAYALPHITAGLAVLVFAVNYLRPLYQSLVLLVVVYATVFLSQATGPAKAALLQVNPNLEHASRGLGVGGFLTLVRVTLPLIWRGLLTGGALVFLTTMKELPVTLLLRPTGFDTLAVRIWTAADELFYARAATSALVLLAVSALPMYLFVIRPRTEAT